MPDVGQTATANLALRVTDAPWRSPLLFSMKPDGPGVSKQVDTVLPPTFHQHCVSLIMTALGATPGESLLSLGAQRSFSERKASAHSACLGHPLVTNGQFNVCPAGTRNQASEPPQARGPASLGLEEVAAGRVHPGAPNPALPFFSPAASFQALQRSNVLHSETGRMFWLWESRLRPEGRSDRRRRTLFRISWQLLRYWCRSKEYTKGSDAALL